MFLNHIFEFLHSAERPPAVMSAQPPGELALAAQAVRGLH